MKILFIAYDNESYLTSFPLGIGYLAAMLRQKGCEVSIYNQDVYHYPEEHLSAYLTHNHFDLVGVGVIGGYYQYRKLLKISEAINSVPQKKVLLCYRRPWAFPRTRVLFTENRGRRRGYG